MVEVQICGLKEGSSVKAMQPDSHYDVHVKLYVVLVEPPDKRQNFYSSIGSEDPENPSPVAKRRFPCPLFLH